ncbi:MAG: hypothetical protein IT198_01715 [Acidimicrobiia bacterium]|nr:hypothetical protein [Acidimicrobiia bacterium]
MRWRLAVVVSVLGVGLSACVAPILVTAPTVLGVAQVGETLTATNGTWLLSGSYAYKWQRCEVDGTGCVDITGATAKTFVPTVSEEGKRVRVRVTNTNQFGAQSASSALTGPVTPAAASPSTSRVSVATGGTQADNSSEAPSV